MSDSIDWEASECRDAQTHLMSTKEYVREFFKDQNGFDSDTIRGLLDSEIDKADNVFLRLSFAADYLFAGYFPASWQGLRTIQHDPQLKSLTALLRWTVLRLKRHQVELKACIASRDSIESGFMLGEFQKCRTDLSEHEAKNGVSLWSLAFHFRLCESLHGTQFNRTELLRFLSEKRPNRHKQWANYLASVFSTKAESGLSELEFSEKFRFIESDALGLGTYCINYLKYRLLGVAPQDEASCLDVLDYEARHSLLDLYDTFSQILSLNDIVEIADDLWKPICEIADFIGDNVLQLVISAQRPFRPIKKHDEVNEYSAAANACFLGDYDNALNFAIQATKRFPRHFGGYKIAGLAAAHLQGRERIDTIESVVQNKIVRAVFDWYAQSSDKKVAIATMHRLSRFFGGTLLGVGISRFILQNLQGVDPLCTDRISVLAMPCQSPIQSLCFTNRTNGAEYFAAIHTGDELTTTEKAVCKLLVNQEVGDSFSEMSSARALHLRAIAAFESNDYVRVSELLHSLRIDHPSYYAVRPEAQALEAHSLVAISEIEAAARLTGALYSQNPAAVPPVLLEMFIPFVTSDVRAFDKSNISWPIIANAMLQDGLAKISVDHVHDFVSDYIESHSCCLPTELLSKLGNEMSREVLVFFRDCCTTQILESSIWIDSQERLLRERLTLCENIRNIADLPPLGIEGEIGSLMRKLAVLDVTQRVERSRIYVDIERIRERIPDSLDDMATRLLAMIALRNDEFKRGLKLLGMPNRDGGNLIVITVDKGHELFSSIFDHIKEQYLFSPELGLDANLSQSIRHGPIISGIRSIFDRSQLITRRSAQGDYLPNSFWLRHFSEGPEARVAEKAFAKLASSVDGFIKKVRDEEIQIFTKEKSNGLFNYEFSESEMSVLLAKIEPLHDIEDVYEIVLDAMVARTERCLEVVRARVERDWSEELHSLLTEVCESIESFAVDAGRLIPLRSAITDCNTEMSRGLEKIAAWFTQDDVREHKSFTLRSLLKTFELVASKSGQKCTVIAEGDDGSDDAPIIGAHFRSFWNLFFILIDNALNHSGLDHTIVEVKASLGNRETSLVVRNSLSNEKDVKEIRRHIDQLNLLSLDKSSDLVKLRSEGGSGVAKLHKIVRYEIGNDNIPYSVSLSLTDELQFEVRIKFQIGIRDDSIHS